MFPACDGHWAFELRSVRSLSPGAPVGSQEERGGARNVSWEKVQPQARRLWEADGSRPVVLSTAVAFTSFYD